jgi:hypothetical protein
MSPEHGIGKSRRNGHDRPPAGRLAHRDFAGADPALSSRARKDIVMDTQHDRDLISEIGVFSVVAPAVWVIAATVGLALLTNRPEWFADAARMQAGPPPGMPAPASVQPSQDPSVPQASTVLVGHSPEAPRAVAVP